jgi:iron complex outermembrane receptor protein
MGAIVFRRTAGAMALAGIMAGVPDGQARAQSDLLPALNVTASRLFGGITGTSTTVITAEDIERAPQQTLVEILSREAGVQTSSFYNGVNGVGTTIDMRGFGITGAANTLVLVNGRRLNDWDLTGADLSAIPRNSIERVEITRGNSGAVLYGDGAVGGVINIVTKAPVAGAKPSGRIEGGFGSFDAWDGNAGVNGSSGPFSVSAYGNAIRSDGYRVNNEIHRLNGVGEIRYNVEQGTAFFNIAAEDLRTRTPGARIYSPSLDINEPVTDRRGTSTPFDFGDRQSLNLTTGFTRTLWGGAELIVDGGYRQKDTQFGTFDPVGSPYGYNDTTLTTSSITPRMRISQSLFGLPSEILTGLDVYRTDYDSARSAYQGAPPRHRYLLDNNSVAAYWQQTVSVLPTTDFSFGGRVQRDSTSGRDAFNSSAPNGPLGTGSACRSTRTRPIMPIIWVLSTGSPTVSQFSAVSRKVSACRMSTSASALRW